MCVLLYDDVLFSGKGIQFKNRMYVTFCCLHGKTLRTKCNLKVTISLNSWIYNKKVIIVDCTIPIGSSNMEVIWALVQICLGIVQSTV